MLLSNLQRRTLRPFARVSTRHRLHHPRRLTKAAEALIQDAHDFGNYDIILPEEPFVFGVSHITPRRVPEGILRPDYAKPEFSAENIRNARNLVERITLGGEAEARQREAGMLARKALGCAGRLVQVRRCQYPFRAAPDGWGSRALQQTASMQRFTSSSFRTSPIPRPSSI